MNKDFVREEINRRLEHVSECINALKCAKEAIPREGEGSVVGVQIYCMVHVLTESLSSAVDVATEDLIEYMSSWQD